MADMRFEATKEFVRRWRNIKNGVHAPVRSAVELRDIAEFLPKVFIVSSVDARWVFSLAGTQFYDLYGGELTGTPFAEMWGVGFKRLPEAMAAAAHHIRPLLIHSVALANGEEAFAETVLLPLRARSEFADVDRFIGLQTFPAGKTWWAGARSISAMDAVSFSLIEEAGLRFEEERRGRETPAISSRIGKPSLRVFEGGLIA